MGAYEEKESDEYQDAADEPEPPLPTLEENVRAALRDPVYIEVEP